jgi:hypothetical protein
VVLSAACLGFGLAGCGGLANVPQRRAMYEAVLQIPVQIQAALQEKTSFYDELLTRTSTPAVEPYAALKADLDAMAAPLGALQQDQSAGDALIKDFDAFAAAHGAATVSSGQGADWDAYQQLNGRFHYLARDIRAHAAVYKQASDQFDGLLQVFDISRQDSAAALQGLSQGHAELDQGIKEMEAQLNEDSHSLDFDEGSSLDPDLKAQKRAIVEEMQEHLIKTEGLVRRSLQTADAMQAAWPEGKWLWTGPGLPENGQDLAKFWRERDAFRRRQAEFEALVDSFDAVGHVGD